ncbi:MAG: hypothetical protein ACR2O4_14240 [Hyphomicrobiaceae bacterium]
MSDTINYATLKHRNVRVRTDCRYGGLLEGVGPTASELSYVSLLTSTIAAVFGHRA